VKSVKEYNGPRESAGIVDHAFQTLEAAGVPLNIPQLTSQKELDSACAVGKICAIIFLPHIYDSSATTRQAYISTIAEAAKAVRGTPFSFFWSEGGAQEALESSLNINNAYPTLSVLSLEKRVFAVQKVSWSAKNVKAFLNGIISGR
jgi:protein disulfide-isomerase A6